MAVYTDEMFNSTSEATALTDMFAGSSAAVGPYNVPYAGKLLKVVILWAGEAATSLVENVRVELNCKIWKPNVLKFGLVGAGIRTAPAFPIPPFAWGIDQPVKTDQGITGQIAQPTAATPITNNTRVFGVFETQPGL